MLSRSITIIILAFTSFTTSAQTVKNLVFEGAGIRGLAYGGAIAELEEQHMLDSLEKVGGTSAGAITAMMLSVGYTAEELTDIVFETPYEEFNSGKYIVFGGMYRMNKHYGWYMGDKVDKWLGSLLEAKTGNADITFAQLKSEGFKELTVTGTSLNHQKLMIFSANTYPHMKVRDAVRVSMSVPLYFEAVFVDSVGQVLKEQPTKGYYDIAVDGGLTANFPIDMFDSVYLENGRAYRIANPHTLGVRIDTDPQIEADKQQIGLAEQPIDGLPDYVQAFYTYVLENLNRTHLTPADWKRTISVSSAGIGPKVKALDETQRENLFMAGQDGVREFVDRTMDDGR